MKVWYKLGDAQASLVDLPSGATVQSLKLEVVTLDAVALSEGRSLGNIKVYLARTTVPVPNGDESLEPLEPLKPSYEIQPGDSTCEMPYIVVVPAPPQQYGESTGLHEYVHKCVSPIITMMRGLDARLSAISPTHDNPWMTGYEAEKKKTPRKIDMRNAAITHYYGDKALRGANRGLIAVCCVTGCRGFDHEVNAAHILPHGSPKHWDKTLDIKDRDNVRNIVLLCKNIENAFDKLQLCFLRHKEEPGAYELKVWDKEGLKDTILYMQHNRNNGSVAFTNGTVEDTDAKSSSLITDYDGHVFRFAEYKHPFSRLLSYHAQESYKWALAKKWIASNEECPEEYGSPFDNDLMLCHNSVDSLRRGDTSTTSETSLSARKFSYPTCRSMRSFFRFTSEVIEGMSAALWKSRRSFRLQLGDVSFDISPWSRSETMGVVLKRAQDDVDCGVFQNFTAQELQAYTDEKIFLCVKLVKKDYEFEKKAFTVLSVNDVYTMTDDDPIRLEFFMEDKKAPASNDRVDFF
jgi:hypothetical protein